MAIEYDKSAQEIYGLSSDELYKADVTVAALLNGYLLKQDTQLAGDKVSFFIRLDNKGCLKSFVMPKGNLSETDKRVIAWNLKTDGKALDKDYYNDNIVAKHNPETVNTLLEFAKNTLVKENGELSQFHSDRLNMVSSLNKNRVMVGESGR